VRVASTPASFGVLQAAAVESGLPDSDAVLDAIVAAGFAGTELGPPGYLGGGNAAAEALGQRGLGLAGALQTMRLSRREHADEDTARLDRTLAILDEATPSGERPVVLIGDAVAEPDRVAGAGRIERLPGTWLSDARFDLLVARAHRAAERCRERGYDAAFRYHGGTFVETPREIDRLAERLDQSVIGLCYDAGQSAFGGGDPVAFLDTYAELVTHVHLSDVDLAVMDEIRRAGLDLREAWRRGVFCPLGEGGIDVDAVLGRLRAAGYDAWVVVEQERLLEPGQPLDAAAAAQSHNREALRELGI